MSDEIEVKKRELEELLSRARALETEIQDVEADAGWAPHGFYAAYYATTGFLLGIFGAITSLLFNIIGSLIVGKSPMELIRVYLTFPLGEQALQLADTANKVYAVPDSAILAMGCCLYLATGMLLGIPLYLALAFFTPKGPMVKRFLVATVVALLIWVVNFYGILSWLQPLLVGGNWVTNQAILPWWVAAATHVIFGWTIVLIYPFGEYKPYLRPTPEPTEVANPV